MCLFAVSKLARFMQAPPSKLGLYGYFDASFADCVDTRRSTVHMCLLWRAAISWKTKLYTFVTTSSNHSELVASAMAAREAKFLLLLVSSLGFNTPAAPRPVQLRSGQAHSGADLFTDSMGGCCNV